MTKRRPVKTVMEDLNGNEEVLEPLDVPEIDPDVEGERVMPGMATRFKPGHKKLGGGLNKPGQKPPKGFTENLRQAAMRAAREVGFDGTGKDGLVGYLRRVARGDPRVFNQLLLRLIQADQTQSDAKPNSKPAAPTSKDTIDLSRLTAAELADLYRETVSAPEEVAGKS